MCNPGGATALLGLAPFMASLREGASLAALEEAAGRELGVIRVSFGLVSNFADAWAVVCWARTGVHAHWRGFRNVQDAAHCGASCAASAAAGAHAI